MPSPWRDPTVSFSAHKRRRAFRRLAYPLIALGSSVRRSFGFIAFVIASGVLVLAYAELEAPFSTNPASSSAIVGRAHVVDGDTLKIRGTRVRFYGIDAPESHQTCLDGSGREYRCGRRATRALAEKIGGETVTCDPRDVDRYGRTVAVCHVGKEDVNGWLVSEGLAVASSRYSLAYILNEIAARIAGRGLWAGTFTTPEDWRRQRR